MTARIVLTVLADATVAAVFLVFGFRWRQWTLLGAGLALIVAPVVLVGAAIWHSDNLMSGSFLLGLAACTVGFIVLATGAKPRNRRL